LKYSTPLLLAAAATSSIISSEVHSKKISKLEESAPTTTQQAQDEILDNSDDLPVYSLADVAFNNGSNGRPIWVSYAGNVYDITKFIANHPGGSDIIVRASGQALEPYWNLYRQHFSSDLPMKILEPLQIGTLNLNEQEKIDEMMEKEYDENNPYRNEPIRHSALKVHTEEPMNAEVPKDLITSSYITPTELHYIRHHHPVPHVTDPKTYNLEIDLSALGRPTVSLTLEDLKSLPKHEVTVTLQCSGNRRGDFNKEVKKTSGTSWDQGAISTAKWAGPKLRDILKLAGLDEDQANLRGIEHVRFESLDGMKASIGLDKAASPYGDCIIAIEMNGEPIVPDHGYPVRAIVPGYCAVRNVKWLKRIELSEAEAEGAWQRGLNYKVLPSGITDAKKVDLSVMPSLQEASVFSGITQLECKDNINNKTAVKPGDQVMVKASGWAWAGGGRNIVRVDLSGDGGKSWVDATITDGHEQKFNRAWAWVFWTCDNIPAIVGEDGKVQISSKAVDAALNSQPESCSHMWNVRGLGNNSWHKASLNVTN